jgi:hypothetical protein
MSGRVGLIVIVGIALAPWALGAEIGDSVAGASTSWKRPSATKVTIFATPIGRAPKAPTRLDGSCVSTSSEVSNRPDAARCFTAQSNARGVNVFDPCFRSEGGSTPGKLNLFFCPNDPWNRSVATTVVAAAGDAGVSGVSPSSFRPWALLLANGQRCLATGGATGSTAGLRYNYACFAPRFARSARQPIGKTGGIVLGDPDQRMRVWTVLFTKDNTGTGFTPVGVRQAYE